MHRRSMATTKSRAPSLHSSMQKALIGFLKWLELSLLLLSLDYLSSPLLHLYAQPVTRNSFGRLLFIIIYDNGIFRGVKEMCQAEVEGLSSFQYMELFIKEGAPVRQTVDCFSFGGIVKLICTDLSVLKADYDRIKELETSGWFIIE